MPDELKRFGFEKFTIPMQGKNLMIWHNGNVILSSFDKHESGKNCKILTKKFNEEGIDQRTIRLFITFLTEEYIKLKDSEF